MQKTSKNTKSLGDKLKDGIKTAAKWGVALAAAAAAGGVAIFAMGVKLGNAADEIVDLAAVTGMSTDEIQSWRKVTEVAGVSTDAVADASAKLTKSMFAMNSEGNKTRQAIEELGFSMEDLENMTPDERMHALTKALAEVEDPAEQARLGSDALTSSWDEMAPIMALGAEGIDDAYDSANKFPPEVLEQANNFRIAWENIKDKVGFFVQMAIGQLLPTLLSMAEWFEDKMPLIESVAEKAFEVMSDAIEKTIETVKDLTTWIKDHWSILEPILAGVAAGAIAYGVFTAAMSAYRAMTVIATAAQWLLTIALNANPLGLIVIAIGLAVAAGVVLYRNWDTIREKVSALWNSMKTIFGNIGSFVGGIWDGLLSGGKTAINGIISALNTMIGGLNKLNIDIPDWVPGNLSSFGFNIPTLPGLATGGNILDSGSVLVGEEGPEILSDMQGARVTPLDRYSTGQPHNTDETNNLLRTIITSLEALKDLTIIMDHRIVGHLAEPYVTERQNLKRNQKKRY